MKVQKTNKFAHKLLPDLPLLFCKLIAHFLQLGLEIIMQRAPQNTILQKNIAKNSWFSGQDNHFLAYKFFGG